MNKKKSPWKSLAMALAFTAAAVGGALLRDQADVGLPISNLGTDQSLTIFASKDLEPDIPEGDYFYYLAELLKDKFVEPVKDDQKLAVGAARGMIASLGDPNASFMNPEQYKAYLLGLTGDYEGIGVELKFEYSKTAMAQLEKEDAGLDPADLVPKLVVSAVVPGGPAETAGIRPGDQIEAINGRYVLSTDSVLKFRAEAKAIRTSKADRATIDLKLRDLQERAKNGTTPMRAKDLAVLGTTGEARIRWVRAGQSHEASIPKRRTTWQPVSKMPDGTIRLTLIKGAAKQLATAIGNAKSVKLDLRNSTQGDSTEVAKCLAVLAPDGSYGEFVTQKGNKPVPLTIKGGRKPPLAIQIVADGSTRGAAEILALALKNKLKVPIQGPPMAGERVLVEASPLPDGSGYLLPTSTYQFATKASGAQKS